MWYKSTEKDLGYNLMCIDVQTLLAGDMCCFEFSGALDGWSSSQGILYMYIFKC